jgi:hypothetical protein
MTISLADKRALKRYFAQIRVKSNAEIGSYCWIWTGPTVKGGYARFKVGDRKVMVHRWAYQFFVGPIPYGKEIDHFLCKNPSCVRPEHLRPATPVENVNNGKTHNAVKTHCIHGHEFTEENTYWGVVRKRGKAYQTRVCRACKRRHQQQASRHVTNRPASKATKAEAQARATVTQAQANRGVIRIRARRDAAA